MSRRGDDGPRLVDVASERAREQAAKIQEKLAHERMSIRATAPLPISREAALIEMSEENRARFASRPRNRRWRALEKHDAKVAELTLRRGEAAAEVKRAEQRLQQAPDEDARSLAAWMAAGEKGDRPAATLPERERERGAARLLADAVAIELDAALEERRRHIEKHRERMLEDARRDVTEASDRLRTHVRQLAELRDVVVAARETLVWTATFPEVVEGYGFPTALCLGLRKPVQETLGTQARIEYRSLVAALEADVAALAEAFSADVKRALGDADPRTPLTEAMWEDDPELVAYKRKELERARELARERDPNVLAQEVRWSP